MDLFEPKTAKNQEITAYSTASERGSAIIWVFVMIALFAALNFAVTQNTRGGMSGLSKQQANLAATEILDYGRAIKSAVQELLISGCDETEISFENTVVAGYTNPNTPSDESCHIFNINGGGLTYLKPSKDWLDDSFAGNATYREWSWGASYNIEGSGTTATDLRMLINFLDQNICIAINNQLNVSNPSDVPPIDNNTGAGVNFVGAYASTPADNIGDDGGHDLPGKATFCRNQSSVPQYQFNQVLIAR